MKANGHTLTRIYSRLHGDEAAALAFGALADGDEAEAERLGAAVSPAEARAYRRRLESCYRLSGWYGIQHHKLRSRLLAAIGLRLYHGEDAQNGQPAQDDRVRWARCLVSLEDALARFCEAHGLDVAAVRSMAEAEDVDRQHGSDAAYFEYASRALGNVF